MALLHLQPNQEPRKPQSDAPQSTEKTYHSPSSNISSRSPIPRTLDSPDAALSPPEDHQQNQAESATLENGDSNKPRISLEEASPQNRLDPACHVIFQNCHMQELAEL